MSSKLNFIPDIDSLRAVAVIMTLGAHFLPETGSFHIPYLWYGVDLFFVISGFLITSILIKTKFSDNSDSRMGVIKNFYVRRMLRLFPIYYIFILFFFGIKHFANVHLWNDSYNLYFFTYFQNWYFFKVGALNSIFSHLWSLGVEEQFYIIWPFIIVFTPVRYFRVIFAALILTSLGLNMFFYHVPVFRNLTFSNVHTLGIGAILAYYYCIKPEDTYYQWFVKYRMPLFIVSLTAFLVFKLAISENPFTVFSSEFFLATTCVLLVLNSVNGWPQFLKPMLGNRVLNHIGKVSYGIYLYHLPIPALLAVFFNKLHISDPIPTNPVIRFIILFLITYALAVLSFYLIEKRFLKLKSRFE